MRFVFKGLIEDGISVPTPNNMAEVVSLVEQILTDFTEPALVFQVQ
jgi:hypothetical protein